jgi:hypothetical protein
MQLAAVTIAGRAIPVAGKDIFFASKAFPIAGSHPYTVASGVIFVADRVTVKLLYLSRWLAE